MPRSSRKPLRRKFSRVGGVTFALLFASASPSWANHVHMEMGPFLGIVLSVEVDPVNPETLYCVAYRGGVFRSTDRGASWTAINKGLPNRQVFSLLIDPGGRGHLYLGTDQGIFYTNHREDSWRLLAPILRERNVRAFAIDPENPDLLYAATDLGVFQGNGKKWTKISRGLLSDDIRKLAISSQRELFAGTFNGVFKKEKKESSWFPINRGLEDKKIRALVIDPSYPKTLYAGTAYGGVFKTTGGKRWRPVNQGLLNSTVLSLIITPEPHQALYAGTVDGVFKSLNGGEKWFPTGQELPFTVASLAFDPNEPRLLYAGSGGRIFKSINAGEKWEDISHQVNYFGPGSLSAKQ